MYCGGEFFQECRIVDFFPEGAGDNDLGASGNADGSSLRVLDSTTGDNRHFGSLAGVGDVFDRHRFFCSATRFRNRSQPSRPLSTCR